MAFETVKKEMKLGTKMEIGEEVFGYVVDFPSGQYGTNLLMEDKEGNTFVFGTSGNLRYLVQDGLIKAGLYTRITRLADKKVKGKVSSQFDVAQDSDDVTANVRISSPVHAPAPTTNVKARIESLKNTVATSNAG